MTKLSEAWDRDFNGRNMGTRLPSSEPHAKVAKAAKGLSLNRGRSSRPRGITKGTKSRERRQGFPWQNIGSRNMGFSLQKVAKVAKGRWNDESRMAKSERNPKSESE